MNAGIFKGLVMNKVVIEGKNLDWVYLLIRERSYTKGAAPNYLPAIYFLRKSKVLAKYFLEEIKPGMVISITYKLKTLNMRIPLYNSNKDFEVKKQPFMVIKDVDILYVFREEEAFKPVEELVDIVKDNLLDSVSKEDMAEIEDLIHDRLEKISNG